MSARLAGIAAVAGVVLAGCGGAATESGDGRAAQPAAPAASDGGKLPPKLAVNVRASNTLVGEGIDDFDARVRSLRGHPIVVNQWASWCTSCRFEFPFFQDAARRHRRQVAFLGIDSQDTRSAAERFMRELPPGFPSIFDPDTKVARKIGAGLAWPTTVFYDRRGEIVHVKVGAYAKADLLEADIRRHALGGA